MVKGKEPSSPAADVPDGAVITAVDGVSVEGQDKNSVVLSIVAAKSKNAGGHVRLPPNAPWRLPPPRSTPTLAPHPSSCGPTRHNHARLTPRLSLSAPAGGC